MKLVSKQDPVNPMLHQQLLINPKLMTLTRVKELKQGEEINSRESTLEQYLYLSVIIIITTTMTIIIMITFIITTTNIIITIITTTVIISIIIINIIYLCWCFFLRLADDPSTRTTAAVKIQSVWRGWHVRHLIDVHMKKVINKSYIACSINARKYEQQNPETCRATLLPPRYHPARNKFSLLQRLVVVARSGNTSKIHTATCNATKSR